MKSRAYTNSKFTNKNIIIVALLITIFCTVLVLLIPKNIVVEAGDSNRVKTVTSVLIKKGDSLWSIAGDYITDEYSDRMDYIEEIKRTNGLTSDVIHEDQYIIVPHYKEVLW